MEEFFKVKEVAKLLGVRKNTVYRWFWQGKLKGIKLSNREIRILARSVKELKIKIER